MNSALTQCSLVATCSQNILDTKEENINKFLATNKHLWRCLSSVCVWEPLCWHSSYQQLSFSSNTERITSRKTRVCMLNLKASAFYNLNNHSGKLYYTSKIKFTKTPSEAGAAASVHPAPASFLFPELKSNSDSTNSHSSSQGRWIHFTATVEPTYA